MTRVEHLSSDVVRIDTNRQFLEDNLLLRRELQTYTEREVHMNERLEQLEKRLNDLKNEKWTLLPKWTLLVCSMLDFSKSKM